ncbi:MAG: glycogen-binding domain-containing protein [Elusimicrobiota bacterium]
MKRLNLYFLISTLLISNLCLYAEPLEPEMTPAGVKFLFNEPSAGKVTIAGDFNKWNKDKNPLVKGEDGIWKITIPLKEGKTEYKFIIDGEWMDGANLIVMLKKNPRTGLLEIPKAKPGIISPYTQKIKFSGKYTGILPLDLKTASDVNLNPVLSTPINHVDLDWNVTPAEQADIFFRTELDTSRQQFNLFFKQGYITFQPTDKYYLKMFYNLKFIQFDNPLKITDVPVGLRYDELYFVNELNPHKGYGLDTQGIFLQAEPLGLNFTLFYSNYKTYQQDDIGLRVKTKSMGPVRFGTTYLGNRGISWPYGWQPWFPDPQYILARSTYTVPNTNIQPWYKGFMYRTFSSFDFKYDILPEAKNREIFFFCEYGISSEELYATRWNENAGKDSPANKTWPIMSKNIFLYGIKTNFSGFNIEVALKKDSGKFSQSISTFVSFDTDYDFGSSLSSLKFRFDSGGYSAGLAVENRENKSFNSVIDSFLSPYNSALAFGGLMKPVNVLVKKDALIVPFIKLKAGERTSIKIIANIVGYEIFPSSALYSGANYLTKTVDHNAATECLDATEGIISLSQNILSNLYIEASGRYSSYKFASTVEPQSYLSFFAALTWRLKKNFMIRLGYGIDPEGLDEDIFEDFDRRELFLYNEYVKNLGAGSSYDAALISAEDSLAKHQRISLRTEIRF